VLSVSSNFQVFSERGETELVNSLPPREKKEIQECNRIFCRLQPDILTLESERAKEREREREAASEGGVLRVCVHIKYN